MTVSPWTGDDAVLVVIDMQEAFAQDTPWRVDTIMDIVPAIRALTRVFERRAIFTRFVYQDPAAWPADAWLEYYRVWNFLPGRADLEEIVGPLAGYTSVEIDKPTYSCLAVPAFLEAVRAMGGKRLVFCGVETEICVLASIFDAIDAGYPCAIVTDACTSSVLETHQAGLDILARMPQQVAMLTMADLGTHVRADGAS